VAGEFVSQSAMGTICVPTELGTSARPDGRGRFGPVGTASDSDHARIKLRVPFRPHSRDGRNCTSTRSCYEHHDSTYCNTSHQMRPYSCTQGARISQYQAPCVPPVRRRASAPRVSYRPNRHAAAKTPALGSTLGFHATFSGEGNGVGAGACMLALPEQPPISSRQAVRVVLPVRRTGSRWL
jgi:hypothetical protein